VVRRCGRATTCRRQAYYLHHRFIDRLFTAGSGTSFAAPLVAHKAAQILAHFPDASANLVRALLAGAARVPDEAQLKLQMLGKEAVSSVCGHGQVDPARASYSDDHRVVLYAEDERPLDHFAVYRIPVLSCSRTAGGARCASHWLLIRRCATPAPTMQGSA
jgi:hypothetical protein